MAAEVVTVLVRRLVTLLRTLATPLVVLVEVVETCKQ